MSVMAIEKKQLSFEDIEAQTALELPDRNLLGAAPPLVIATCVAVCIGTVRIRVEDVNVGIALCAALLNVLVDNEPVFGGCNVTQQ
jgi:hypothetical protein